jgi:LmbE family N-acetylglucosaminyl deacetylase
VESISRRDLLVTAGITASGVSGILPAANADAEGDRKLKIVVAGGHPGDPEAACGGTMARLADSGHEVVALYITQGEKGVDGKTGKEAAAIRTGEAREACALLKARALLFDLPDGNTEINAARYDAFRTVLEMEKPHAVFTHWPIDAHRDHRVCSLLVYDAWLASGRKFALYYYEVSTGEETQHFRPTHYVDITATEKRKRAACFCHVSQNPPKFYVSHEAMQRFRGLESACKLAEAFVHHEQSPATGLPLDR